MAKRRTAPGVDGYKRSLTAEERASRIASTVMHQRRRLQPDREVRLRMIKRFVGPYYYDQGSSIAEKNPLNMLELALNIYIRFVAAKSPQVLVNSRNDENVSYAGDLTIEMNHVLREIEVDRALAFAALDAFFTIGCIKVGLTTSEEDGLGGVLHDAGQPFADYVDFDDLAYDTDAKRWESCRIICDRYTLPYERMMDAKMFKDRDLKPSPNRTTNETGEDRADSLPRQEEEWYEDDYTPTIELWDVWCPFDGATGVMRTFRTDDDGRIMGKALREMEWAGPENGPYHMLSYGDVPGNIKPLTPAMVLLDMHELCNRTFVKLGRQVDRQKTITLVRGGADEDGKRIVDANDGDVYRVDDPNSAKEVRYGGVDQPNLAFLIWLKDVFAYQAGNLDTLGGLSPQAGTLGQERLLAEGSSLNVQDKQDRTVRYFKRIVGDIAQYVWEDPVTQRTFSKPIPGMEHITVPIQMGPSDLREGDRLDYDYEIAPYSWRSRTPSEFLQTYTETFERVIMPLVPVIQASGGAVNTTEILDTIAKYSAMPEIRNMVTVQDAMTALQEQMGLGAPGGGGGPEGAGGVPGEPGGGKTTTHIRENRPQVTRQGKDKVAMAALMGQRSQPYEERRLGAPTG